MKERDPYHLALNALTRSVGEGRFGWGDPLVVTTLAAELRLSATPVREALARLAGEGVIEHRPGRGYYAPSPDADDVLQLYNLHRRLALWALEAGDHVWGPAASRTDAASQEAFFQHLVDGAADRLLSRTMRRTGMQLRPIRAVEATLAPVLADPVAALSEAAATGSEATLVAAIERYHADRRASAPMIVQGMRRAAESIEQI